MYTQTALRNVCTSLSGIKYNARRKSPLGCHIGGYAGNIFIQLCTRQIVPYIVASHGHAPEEACLSTEPKSAACQRCVRRNPQHNQPDASKQPFKHSVEPPAKRAICPVYTSPRVKLASRR